MSAVKYVSDHWQAIESRDSDCLPHGQGANGYGRKIACPYQLRLGGCGPWRRVYAACFSNAASHYVLVNGEEFYLGTFDPRTDGRN